MPSTTAPPTERAARLSALRDRFIAVSMRSRTLRLGRATRSGALDLGRLASLDAPRYVALTSALGAGAHPGVVLCSATSSATALGMFSADIEALSKAARAERVETGADTLAVGWPLLQGKGADGAWLRAPLLLYPCALEKSTKGRARWMLVPTAPPSLNEALIQALARSVGARLDFDAFLERDEDGVFRVDDETWGNLARSLIDSGVPLVDTPTSLPPVRALTRWDALERDAAPHDAFSLQSVLTLGRFPVSSSSIVLDYQEMLAGGMSDAELGAAAPILSIDEDATPDTADALDDLDASGDLAHDPSHGLTWRPLPADDSQDAVARALAQGAERGLVVQGPPGTGKSQMITNLIAGAIARGERVLMVCQKRAALDVVAERLEALGLREPLAVVHDVQRDRQDVCRRLAATLDAALERGGQADTARSERAARKRAHERSSDEARARLGEAQRAWSDLSSADPRRPGLAELDELDAADPDSPQNLPDLTAFAADLTLDDLAREVATVGASAITCAPFARPNPWWRRGDLSACVDPEVRASTLSELDALVSSLESIQRASRASSMTAADALAERDVWADAEALREMLTNSEQARDDFLLFWTWCGGAADDGEWRVVMRRLQTARKELTSAPWALVLEPRARLDAWIRDLEELRALGGRWWRFFSPTFWRLRKTPDEVLEASRLDTASGAPVDLVASCESAIAWQNLIADLPSDSAFFDFGFQGDPEQIDDAIEGVKGHHKLVRQAHVLRDRMSGKGSPWNELPDLDVVSEDELPGLAFFAALSADAARADALTAALGSLDRLSDALSQGWRAELAELAGSGEEARALEMARALCDRRGDVEALAVIDARERDRAPWAISFLRQRAVAPGAELDLRRAARRAWRALILAGRPASAVRAPMCAPTQRAALRRAADDCVAHASGGIDARYRERLEVLSTDTSRNGPLRKLSTQASKQRYRLTLRQLVEKHWEDGLAEARPVWLCSPESVAALFPLQPEMFDLVIFDEASQCPVESSIGALVRARRVVVAGDDQQMPPTHFFRASTDDDLPDEIAEDSSVLASASALGVARAALPQVTLRWHYRSKHEELIGFSNQGFYGGELRTAPSAQRPLDGEEGLRFERVQGYWQDQTNRAEAARCVEIVAGLLDETPAPSVGVVAFNRKQAELVERLIEARREHDPQFAAALARDAARAPADQLFVRNLENVQGDERDHMIMTVGYGPTGPGERVRARFGPLGLEGGEKRLNVAVTRARLGYHVLASFDPGELDVAHTKHVGPKLFKVFLAYAKALTDSDQAEAERRLGEAAALAGAQGVAARARQFATVKVGERTRDELAEMLERGGMHVERGVGMGRLRMDLAVRHPRDASRRVGVDLTSFLSDADAMSREVYTPRFLERMGWRVVRVTPGMWREDPGGVIDTIAHALGGAAE